MPNEVKGTGSIKSEIMLVGEAPGSWENRSGLPFVGPSGKLLGDWWRSVGLARSLFRIDNVYRFQPPGNKLAKAPRDDVNEAAEQLHERIARMTNLKVIVPTGNFALRALLRKPLWDNKSPKISDWRGSVLTYRFEDERECLMIPTKHPAETFRRPTDVPLCVLDWRKIARVLQQGYKPPVEAKFCTKPTRQDVDTFKAQVDAAYKADPKWACMSIDIETNPKAKELICVGFALTTDYAITFKWEKWRRTIRWLCEHPIAKVLQNGLYDSFWLWVKGKITVVNYKWDDIGMHHCYRPYLPHDLGTQISLYTDYPFHKHSAKDEDAIREEKSPYGALAVYNGKDNVRQRALRDVHLEGLRRS